MKKILLIMAMTTGLIFMGIANGYCLETGKNDAEKLKTGVVEKPAAAEYAPGELIIKFNPALGAQAGKLFNEGKSFKSITGTDALDKLNQKHKVKKIERVFKHLEAKGKAKGKDFITSAEDATEIKVKFPQRSKRAPENAKVPDLENIYILELDNPQADIEAIAREYKRDSNVVYAEPNYLAQAMIYPNDPYYSSSNSWGQGYDDLWALKPNKLNCESAWDITQGQGIVVGVIDTGVDYTHEDIAANIWINTDEIPDNRKDDDNNGYIDDVRGYDFIGTDINNKSTTDNDPMDGCGHGTHVAGTIAGVGNNTIGIIGVAPKANVMAVKGLDDQGYGWDSSLVNSIVYAADNGADVLNNSWGGGGTSQVVSDAILHAHNLGCVVMAAAGNSNLDAMNFFPANDPNAITVAASDQNDQKCYFSNYGPKIDVSAPGGNGQGNVYNILSLLVPNSYIATNRSQYIVGGKYLRLAGTSMACPHAVGVVALILVHNPNFTPEDVRQILRATADDIGTPGFDLLTGFGRVNAYKAVQANSVLNVNIASPASKEELNLAKNSLDIIGTASGPDFQSYQLFYAPYIFGSIAPLKWIAISPAVITTPVENGYLGTWNIEQLGAGMYALRLVANTTYGLQFQSAVLVVKEKYTFRQITSNPAPDRQADISGDKVVWIREPINFPKDKRGAYLYDLTIGTERQILSDANGVEDLAISGDKVALTKNYYAYLYDLTTNTERQLTTIATQSNPAISGDKIVWDDYRNTAGICRDIYMYSLDTNTERQITNNPMDQGNPAISGDKIVWGDGRGSNGAQSDIYLYGLATNTERQITTNTSNQWNPAISGNKIVWEDDRNSNYNDIYLYDLTTNTERRITNSIGRHYNPVISGNKIVWEDDRNGNWDIYMYDLTTNTEQQVMFSLYDQRYPRISDNKIIWTDYRNGNEDIYMCDLTPSPDTTPPTTPVVTDEGATTIRTDQLYASWTSSDPESGIAEYQYKITQDSISGALIRDWTSTGATNYVTAGGLSLLNGKSYYFSVKAKNGAGLWSAVGYSDGILVSIPDPNVIQAPSALSATVSANNISLNWLDNSTNEEGFSIERGVKAKGVVTYTQVATVLADTSTYTETVANGTYYYRVRAFNNTTARISNYSNSVQVQVGTKGRK